MYDEFGVIRLMKKRTWRQHVYLFCWQVTYAHKFGQTVHTETLYPLRTLLSKTVANKTNISPLTSNRTSCPEQQFFDVLLTVHLSIILITDNLMHKFLFYNKFIIFLYMFRALLCSSSGGQNCIVQHLVSSHSLGCRAVHRLGESSPNLCTGRPPTECDDTRCCIIQFWPSDAEHHSAGNM